jgi:hypothetical protein
MVSIDHAIILKFRLRLQVKIFFNLSFKIFKTDEIQLSNDTLQQGKR